MKKLYQVGILSAIFLMSGFIAVNMYSSESFPGFHSDAPCNYCHNDPTYALDVEGFDLNDMSDPVWDDNHIWSVNYVPMVNVNNRSEFHFYTMQFLKNSTHIVFKARIADDTMDANDKFAIIFNIDVSNFTIGEFLTEYDEGATTGYMGFADGTADMWFWKQGTTAANTSATVGDYKIDSSRYSADTTQDVTVYPHYGGIGGYGNPQGYIIYFVRALTTGDAQDVQFEEGAAVQYALALWDDTSYIVGHYSSFDKMLVIGDAIGMVDVQVTTVLSTVEVEKTVTADPSGTTSSFTLVTLMAGLLIVIPVAAFMRKRK